MTQQSFLFSGFGGQGVMFVGQLLAYAGMDVGKHVTWIPSYGPEMRGGTAHCTVIISETPIGSPIVSRPDVVIAFNKPSFSKYDPLVAADGLMVVNSSLVTLESERDDVQVLRVPASDLADELGNIRLANVILLGAVLSVKDVLTVTDVEAALNDHIPPHRRNLLNLNIQALNKGAAFVKEQILL